ncbi:hypothetical protein JKP88DRAFT_277183 [Tribonema minus]|uniref:Uncharacterized protein n=1 Tax=Tribonema minus TaxID=303371 RepID=A0A835Z6X4_9STRA|nr:hypothetical protein JKP88DRAFT_277183 [Tribonema minus]
MPMMQHIARCHCRQQVREDAPWAVTDEFLRAYSIDFVCHDALPYDHASSVSDNGGMYEHLNRAGRFIEMRRTEGISTSATSSPVLMNRLRRHSDAAGAPPTDYDEFVRRNVFRGYSAKDMNVSFLKEQAIKFGWENLQAQALAEDLQKAFVTLFDRESAFRTRWRNQRKAIRNRIGVLAKNSLC